jgi:hypothetical protein
MPCIAPGAPPMHEGMRPPDPQRFHPASTEPGGSDVSPVQNFDHIASDDKRFESFRDSAR